MLILLILYVNTFLLVLGDEHVALARGHYEVEDQGGALVKSGFPQTLLHPFPSPLSNNNTWLLPLATAKSAPFSRISSSDSKDCFLAMVCTCHATSAPTRHFSFYRHHIITNTYIHFSYLNISSYLVMGHMSPLGLLWKGYHDI